MKNLLISFFPLMLLYQVGVRQLNPGVEYPYANRTMFASAYTYHLLVDGRDGTTLSTLTVPRGYWLIVYSDSVKSSAADRHQYSGKVAIWTSAQSDAKPGETMTQMIPHSPKIEFTNVVVTVTTIKQ